MKRHQIVATMVIVVCVCFNLQAATRIWLSSMGGLWTSTANWEGGVLPDANDVADLSAAIGTIDLTFNVTVGEIHYNPLFNGATNTLVIKSDTDAPNSRQITFSNSETRGIKTGEGAELQLDVDIYSTRIFKKRGYGNLVIQRKIIAGDLINFNIEQGRVINCGHVEIPGVRFTVGTIEPDAGSPAEYIMRPESTLVTYNDKKYSDVCFGANDLYASGTSSRGVVYHEGGLLDLTVNAMGGAFLNGFAAGGYSLYNLSGGEVNLSNKTVYVGFNGTGVINQAAGVLRAGNINFTSAGGDGTYNLCGGELWLGGNAAKGTGSKAVFNIGGASIYPLAAGYTILSTVETTLTGIGGLTRLCSDGAGYSSVLQALSGSGGIVKEGADTVTLSGAAHSFSGPVIVSNGTLNVNHHMNGNNAVLVDGGTMNIGAITVNYSSLMVTNGVLQVSAGTTLKINSDAPTLRVAGSGTVKMMPGSSLPLLAALDVSESGAIDLSGGGTVNVHKLILSGVEQPPGVYTENNCGVISGSGSMVVNYGGWTGESGDSLWSSSANWAGGAMPTGLNVAIDLSGAVTADDPAAILTFDVPAVTNSYLILDSGINGAVVTNASPAGVTNKLVLANHGVIYVGAGETLVLDNEVIAIGNIYKRGEGALILGHGARRLATGDMYFTVEGGKVESLGTFHNLLISAGKPERSVAGPIPEFVLADTPDTGVSGYAFLTAMSPVAASVNPGCGRITQRGGLVEPMISWGNVCVPGFAAAGSSVGGTGVYHLAGGTLKVNTGKTFTLSLNKGYGVFHQSGGVAEIARFTTGTGLIKLEGGIFQVGTIYNTTPVLTTYEFGGVRFEPREGGDNDFHVSSPVVFSGVGGDPTLMLETGRSLTFSSTAAGPGGFVKEGSGTLNFNNVGSFAGLAEIRGGTVNVSGSWQGANSVLLNNGALNVTGTLGVRLSELAITNGTFSLGSGVVAIAGKAFYQGSELLPGEYTALSNPEVVSGTGVLIVGMEPGDWTGESGDGKWSSTDNWVAGIIPRTSQLRANLSHAVSNDSLVNTLLFDLPGVTNMSLKLDSGFAGAVVTNASPSGVTNRLYMAANGIIEVGADETLVLDHAFNMLGHLYKRGGGTLVLNGPALSQTVLSYIYIEGGRVVMRDSMSDILISAGKPDRSVPGVTPELVIEDTPTAVFSGRSFLGAMSVLDSSIRPGNGVITQNGGWVEPEIEWANRMLVGFVSSLAEAGGTGTYHLVNGTLRILNTISLARNNAYGIYRQSGGDAFIQTLATTGPGEVHLTGGNSVFNNIASSYPGQSTFFLGGGNLRLMGDGMTSVTLPDPVVFTGVGGEMTFTIDEGLQLRLNNESFGDAGFIKEGAGKLVLANKASFAGAAVINGGTCTLGDNCMLTQCSNMVISSSANLQLEGSGPVFSTNMYLRVAAGAMVDLNFEGEAEVGHLVVGGREWQGQGTRYGSSESTGTVDKVYDSIFSGTGVLKVVGPRGPHGSLILLQ